MPENKIGDEQSRILRCWWMFELFSPQKMPKSKVVEKKNKKAGKQYVDIFYQAIEWGPGDDLPWDMRSGLRVPTEYEGEKEWEHSVYLGVYSLGATYQWLHRVFEDDADAYEAQPSEESACAAFVVDHQGQVVPETAILSSALWGVGRLRDPGPHDPAWSEGFDDTAASFTARFDGIAEKLLREVYQNSFSARHVEPRLTMGILQRLCRFAQEVAGVDGIRDLATNRIMIESRLVSKKDEKPKLDFLNSFFLKDLNKVRRSGVSLGSALDEYLTSEEALPQSQRIDVIAQPDVVKRGAAAERIPLGRWPANPAHGLALSQQFAVNKVLSELADKRGIVGVNGPPGTGKTTMLRDILAGNIVERACRLAELDDPGDAFLPKRYTVADGQYSRDFYPLRPDLTGFEMVVASSNNNAVENVSTEIPELSAIDKRWQGERGYFTNLASGILTASLHDLRAKQKSPKAWGLVAGTLGSKKNRMYFRKMFWFGAGFEERKELKKKYPGIMLGMLDLLNQWRGKGYVPQKNWEEARRDFYQAKQRVEVLIEERIQAQQCLQKLDKLAAQVRSREADCQNIQDDFQRVQDLAESCRLESRRLEEELTYATTQYERQLALKPGFFETLFSLGKASRVWREEARPFAESLSELEEKVRENVRHQQSCEAEGRRLQDALSASSEQLEDVRRKYNTLAAQCAKDREKCGLSYPDAEWVGDQRELYAPWLDAELDQARSELFFAALELHRDFIELNAENMRWGLKAAMDVIADGAAGFSQEKALAAWQLFFLAVPMVSTTFASAERMLGNVGPESLGWLFIDEAGQASPQHAVGAIWRARRVVAVGDPLQLEPVVTMPKKAQSDIAATYGVSQTWIPPKASVQTLADRVSLYGTTLTQGDENVWVSSPLRVHRRCDDPMFTLCNQIAYNNIMVNGVHRGSADLSRFAVTDDPTIKVSCWIHEPAPQAGSHIQDNQIEQVKREIDYLQEQGVQAQDIIAIAPFRDVANELSNLPDQYAKYKGLTAGTIHTAQGREAAVVLLVLSADPEKDGAKVWAAEKVNLVNVAASRAKRRLYVVGDKDAWAQHNYFRELAEILEPEDQVPSTTQ